MRAAKAAAAVFALALIATSRLAAQRLADFTAPQPLPAGGVLIVGFLGGFERWNDEERGIRKVALDLRSAGLSNVFVETVGNHRRRTALKLIRRALDSNRNGRLEPEEAQSAKVILYGQSWGGAAVVKTARDLNRRGVPVLLTVQVDSVGLRDGLIPPNVRSAANFFQADLLTIRGQTEIRAADPARTTILGNFQFTYYFHPMDPDASWVRRKFGGSHAKMELDPMIWAQVKQLILDAIP